jgi:hypothetical protein
MERLNCAELGTEIDEPIHEAWLLGFRKRRDGRLL